MHNTTVANICFSKSWGGLEMSSVKMTDLFSRAGYRSLAACPPGSPILKALHQLELPAKAISSRKYFSPGATLAVRKWIIQEKINTIFLHALKDLWLVAPALANMPDVKLYGFARMMIRGVSKKDFLHRQLYGRLNGLITFTDNQRKALLECLPVPPGKYIHIPNGVDTERFQPRPSNLEIRNQWGVEPDHFLFGLIGRLDRQKGSLEFVEAANEVLKDYPGARFVLVGGNTIGEGDFDQALKALIKDLKLEGKVILTDFRKDVPQVMNALDAFVMASYEEAFGNVTIEALASGLPVLGTNSGGTPELLDQGQAGLLFEPRSHESMAKAMLTLLAAPEQAKQLAHKSRQRAVNHYDMNKIFARVESLVL